MGKRRRERDRPKAAHDALYNPNKRVLLSYESDKEVEEGEVSADENPLLERPVASYSEEQIEVAEATADLNEDTTQPHEHGLVQENGDAEDGTQPEEQERPNEPSLWSRPIAKNISTGQWAAIGSLSYAYEDDEEEQEEEEFESGQEEAMAYLRAVRSERQAMPDFFVAAPTYSNSELYDNGIGDTRGRYADGAYVAAPVSGPTLPESAKTHVEPKEAFARALKERFLKQRQHMHTSPSPASVENMDKKLPTSFPKENNQATGRWLKALSTVAPQPNQVRLMDQESIMRVLELVQTRFLVREKDISSVTSAWIWSLFARLDDVGTMDGDRVALLRDFGKRAVLVQLSFRDPEAAAQLERVSDAEHGVVASKNVASVPKKDHSEAEPALDEAKRSNTMATLDTILILVGEIFGQRDLQEFRQPWTPNEDESQGEQPNGVENAATADAG